MSSHSSSLSSFSSIRSSVGSSLRRDASLVPILRLLLDEAGVRRSGERMGKTRGRSKVDARGVMSSSSSSFESSLNRGALSVLMLRSLFEAAVERRRGEPAGNDTAKGSLGVTSSSPFSFKSSLNRAARSDMTLSLAFETAGERCERTGKAAVKGSISSRLVHTLQTKVGEVSTYWNSRNKIYHPRLLRTVLLLEGPQLMRVVLEIFQV